MRFWGNSAKRPQGSKRCGNQIRRNFVPVAVSGERELPHRFEETALHEELSKTSLGAAVDAGADLEKLRETCVHGRVLELTHTIRLEKENFYKGGVFQAAEAKAYVASITGKKEHGKTYSRNDVLRMKLRKLGGGYAGVADKYLDTELLKAYKANAPEVVEAKKDPFYAPKLKAMMGSVRDTLLKGNCGVDVLSSLINIVVVFMSSIKGPVLATDGAAQCPTMCRIALTLILAYRSHHLCADGVAGVAHLDEPEASERHNV